ncbi:MAG: hypothetical protein R3C31_08465 [Hyphomonadaceae bacterium]
MTIWFYPIDWATTGAWMQAYAGFAGASAVVYAAARGGSSFDSWLRQKIRERKMAIGERVLTAVYKAKDAFPAIRSALHFGQELAAAEKKLEETYENYNLETNGKKQKLKTAQVIFDRMSSYTDTWKELYECLPIARAMFGAPLEEAIRDILKQRHHLSVSAQMYPDTDPHSDKDFYQSINADIWEGTAQAYKKPDNITTGVASAVERAEAIVLPALSESTADRPSGWGLLRKILGQKPSTGQEL